MVQLSEGGEKNNDHNLIDPYWHLEFLSRTWYNVVCCITIEKQHYSLPPKTNTSWLKGTGYKVPPNKSKAPTVLVQESD